MSLPDLSAYLASVRSLYPYGIPIAKRTTTVVFAGAVSAEDRELFAGAVTKGLKLDIGATALLEAATIEEAIERAEPLGARCLVCLGLPGKMPERGDVVCTVSLAEARQEKVSKKRLWDDLQRVLPLIS
jgi:hypothetical protein